MSKQRLTLIFISFSCIFLPHLKGEDIRFDDYFQNITMRVDYFHTGNSQTEIFAIDRIVNDGAWAGSLTQLQDRTNLGLYFFEIIDKEQNIVIYSRGFASIFGEWQLTPEATEYGTFHESVRFPWPLKPFILAISKRASDNSFQKIWQHEIDPYSRLVNPAELKLPFESWALKDNGDPHSKVDIVILGDGYSHEQFEKFKADAIRLMRELFSVQPFQSREKDFNVRAIFTPCEQPGVNKPHPNIYARTPLSLTYGAFDSERYVLGFDNRTIRDVASIVPYEFSIILVNERTYGGGGIYNLYSTVSADNKFADYIMVHEFGHQFAALADEYYSSSVSYEAPLVEIEPWEPNITALKDPNMLKWKHLVEPSTPIPTPWDKETFDKFSYQIQIERNQIRAKNEPEEVMEALFESERKFETELIDKMKYTGKVGAFEGAGYNQYGMYRAETDCIMFTRNRQAFCKVCQEAISKIIDVYVH
jgi:hypothetical protein